MTAELVITVVFMIFALMGCERMDNIEKHYSMCSELSVDDEPGNWIPSFIPNTATNIRLSAKIDTGEQLLSFSFADNFYNRLCELASRDQIKLPPKGFALVKAWWPDDLVRGNKNLSGYSYYLCEGGYNLIITHREQPNRAYLINILKGR